MLDSIVLMKGTPAPNRSEALDRDDEVAGLFIMPPEDVAAFNFKISTSDKTGVTMMGTIDRPTPGFGAGPFPNKGLSPQDGNALGATREGCGWLQRNFNNRPLLALATPTFVARVQGLRNLPNATKLLAPGSEIGQWVSANAAVQPDSDAVLCPVVETYISPYSPEDAKTLGFPLGFSPQKAFCQARGINSKCPSDVTRRKLGTYWSDNQSSGADDAADQPYSNGSRLPSLHAFSTFSSEPPYNTELLTTAWWGHINRLGQ